MLLLLLAGWGEATAEATPIGAPTRLEPIHTSRLDVIDSVHLEGVPSVRLDA